MAEDPLSEAATIAFDLSAHALEQQEATLRELRSRTGTLLAAASLTASFFGAQALQRSGLSAGSTLALIVTLTTLIMCVYVLMPKPGLTFVLRGSKLYEYFHSEGINDAAEMHRRLAYYLDAARENNAQVLGRMTTTYALACVTLGVEIVLWALDLTGTLS